MTGRVEAPPGEVLVLGLGNSLQADDGAGPRVVEMLAHHSDLPANVRVMDGGLPGWGLPSWLEGWSNLILVDAVDMGASPGEWRCFRWEDHEDWVLWMEDEALSLHQPGLANGLALAQALDMLPEKLLLYGIQPGNIEAGSTLSPQVSASLPGLVEAILDELNRFFQT